MSLHNMRTRVFEDEPWFAAADVVALFRNIARQATEADEPGIANVQTAFADALELLLHNRELDPDAPSLVLPIVKRGEDN